MRPRYSVVGAPTSAGAHHAGQDRAPAALRARGLIKRLRGAGLDVVDVGDIAGEVWTADRFEARTRNVNAVVRVAHAVAEAVERETSAGRVPLVVGGDCTITVGVVAGLQRVRDDVRVAYFDGDADLNSPEHTTSGVLDATGVAHLLGIADTPLAHLGQQHPMLADHQLSLLGYDPSDPDSYDADALASRPSLVHASYLDVLQDPEGSARRTLEAVTGDRSAVVVHFDIDSVDSRDLPLANFPHYGTGVPLAVAGRCLRILAQTPRLAAVVLTELNPTHDPEGALLDRYIDTVAHALGSPPTR